MTNKLNFKYYGPMKNEQYYTGFYFRIPNNHHCLQLVKELRYKIVALHLFGITAFDNKGFMSYFLQSSILLKQADHLGLCNYHHLSSTPSPSHKLNTPLTIGVPTTPAK